MPATWSSADSLLVYARLLDPKNKEEADIEGTMRYCQDLDISPEDVVMLAVAWLTKAPTMGKFTKKSWIEAWKTVRQVPTSSFLSFSPLSHRICVRSRYVLALNRILTRSIIHLFQQGHDRTSATAYFHLAGRAAEP